MVSTEGPKRHPGTDNSGGEKGTVADCRAVGGSWGCGVAGASAQLGTSWGWEKGSV